MAPVFKVAVVQMRSAPGRPEENRTRSVEWIEKAARAGAGLVVLPELCACGYELQNAEQARACSEPVPDGPTCAAWHEAASRHGLYVAGGLAERGEDRPYNAAVLIGPRGWIGTYRKAHLFYRETEMFTPGDTGFPVWETPLGRLSILICYDLRFPEAVRSLALAGADCLLVPTAWVVLSGQAADDRGLCMQAYCAMAHASMNQMAVACADTVGPFGRSSFLGGSLVAGPAGWPLAGPASMADEEMLVADLDIEAIRRSRRRTPYNDTFGDRRTDLYEATSRGGRR